MHESISEMVFLDPLTSTQMMLHRNISRSISQQQHCISDHLQQYVSMTPTTLEKRTIRYVEITNSKSFLTPKDSEDLSLLRPYFQKLGRWSFV